MPPCNFIAKGPNSSTEKNFSLGPRFDSISVSSYINLIIEQTGNESLKIEADDNVIPLVKTSVIKIHEVLGDE